MPTNDTARAASKRTQRTGDDPPLNASARSAIASGALWLGELKLRHQTPRNRSQNRNGTLDEFRFTPASSGTPRVATGSAMKPTQLIDFFKTRVEKASAEAIPAPQAPGAPTRVDDRIDPMVYVTRGEMRNFLQTV